jgi:hypothetical protein
MFAERTRTVCINDFTDNLPFDTHIRIIPGSESARHLERGRGLLDVL